MHLCVCVLGYFWYLYFCAKVVLNMNLSASTGDPYQMKTDSAVAAACPQESEMCATPIFVQHQIYAQRSKLNFAKV